MIYVECKPDSELMECLLGAKREIIHVMGRNRICNKLRRERNCIGLIDEDPGKSQHPYLKVLSVKINLSKEKLKVLHDSRNKNRLIVLCPRLEEWILEGAKEINVKLKNYNLPSNGEGLHRIINLSLDKFKILLEHLKSSGRFKTLERLLSEEIK